MKRTIMLSLGALSLFLIFTYIIILDKQQLYGSLIMNLDQTLNVYYENFDRKSNRQFPRNLYDISFTHHSNEIIAVKKEINRDIIVLADIIEDQILFHNITEILTYSTEDKISHPQLSPCRTKIAFFKGDLAVYYDLLKGKEISIAQISKDYDNLYWFDSESIIYSKQSTNQKLEELQSRDILLYNTSTGEQEILVKDKRGFSLSCDQSMLAYIEDQSMVHVLDLATKNLKQLSINELRDGPKLKNNKSDTNSLSLGTKIGVSPTGRYVAVGVFSPSSHLIVIDVEKEKVNDFYVGLYGYTTHFTSMDWCEGSSKE